MTSLMSMRPGSLGYSIRGVAKGKLVLSGSPTEAAKANVSGLEDAMLIARPYDDVKRFDTATSRLLASRVRAAPASVPNR
jgi:hypothetical protein